MFGDFEEEKATKVKAKGTMALRTLRRPKVQTLRNLIDAKEDLDEAKILLAEEAGMEGLLNMANHEHPKISGGACRVVNMLTRDDDDEVTITNPRGYELLVDSATVKDNVVRGHALMTLAILAENYEVHDMLVDAAKVKRVVGWLKTDVADILMGTLVLVGNLAHSSEYREAMTKEGVGKALAPHVATTDVDVQRALATAMANLVQEPEVAADFATPATMTHVRNWLNSGDADVLSGAVFVCANVSSEDEHRDVLLNAQVLPMLVKFFASDDERVQLGSIITVSNLASVEDNVEVCGQALAPALKLGASTQNPDMLYRVAMALNNLASNESNHGALKGTALPLLNQLAEHTDGEVAKEAAFALAELGERAPLAAAADEEEEDEEPDAPVEDAEEANRAKISEIVAQLSSDDASHVTQACEDLAEMALRQENRAIIRAVGGIPPLVAVLADMKYGPHIKVTAVKALAELAKQPKNRIRMRKANVIVPAAALLTNADLLLTRHLLQLLNHLIASKDLLDQLRHEPVVGTLMQAATNTNAKDSQAVALRVLAFLAMKTPAVQVEVVGKKGLPMLSGIVKAKAFDAAIKVAAIHAMGAVVSGNRRLRQLARKAGWVTLVCKQFGALGEEGDKAVAMSLSYLADHDMSSQNQVRKSGGVEGLVNLCRSRNQSLQENALCAIRNTCRGNPKVQRAYRQRKAIAPVGELLASPNDGVKAFAASALLELARANRKNQDAIASAAIMQLLVHELDNPSDSVKYHVEGVLWALCESNVKRRQVAIDAGAIPRLQHLAKSSPSQQVKKGASWTLAALQKKKGKK